MNGYAVRDAVLIDSAIVACSATTSAVVWRIALLDSLGSNNTAGTTTYIASDVPYTFTGAVNQRVAW